MPRLAFLTCAKFPELSPDDRLAVSALKDRGASVSPVVWDAVAPESLRGFDLVVVRSVWDYHLKTPAFSAWLDEADFQGVRLSNAAPVLRWNMSKRYLLELEAAGVPIVPTLWTESAPAALPWPRVVVKPEVSASSDLTFLLESSDRAGIAHAIGRIRDRCGAMIQPFSESVATAGETSLVYFGGQLSHAVLKRPKPGDFRVQAEYGGVAEKIAADPKLVAIAERCLARVPGDWSYARVDFMPVEGRPCLSELELIDPWLHLGDEPTAPQRFADCLAARCRPN